MLLRLSPDLPKADLDSILFACKGLGYEPRFLDERRRLLELSGEGAPGHACALGDHPGVVQVIDGAHLLAERAPGQDELCVRLAVGSSPGGACFGAGTAALIAGPCAVQSEARLLEVAHAVRDAGATALRGGAWKPRTSPYSFQGLGEEGLAMLVRARAETGLAIVTEVLDPRHVELAAEHVDCFQIGSRNMGNAPLLTEVGRAGKPVLLKRGMSASVREFLLAAEYVLAEGNGDVILCERGVRGFDSATRNLLDVGTVALLKRTTHLPVIVDPSHAAGKAALVRPLARAGLAAGADGLIVEVHPAPHETRSDGAQALSPSEFAALARDTRALLALDGRRLAELPRGERAHELAPEPRQAPTYAQAQASQYSPRSTSVEHPAASPNSLPEESTL